MPFSFHVFTLFLKINDYFYKKTMKVFFQNEVKN